METPHLVHLVLGGGWLVMGRRRLRLYSRCSVWLGSGVPHAMTLDDHSIALGPVLSAGVEPPVPVCQLGVVPALTDLMLARLAANPETQEQRDVFTQEIERTLANLDLEAFPATDPVHPVARRVGEEARRAGLTLEELAERNGISPRHLQRIFLEETGLSFSRWRLRHRLSRASKSLAGGASVSTAARLAGFSSGFSLLRAMSRESDLNIDRLREDPVGCLRARGGAQRASHS